MKYKAKTGVVKTGSFSMEYAVFGEGAKFFVMLPGVSLHSVILSADSIAAAYEAFGEEYTVYVFERVTDIPEGYTVSDMADDTASALQDLGISGAYVFGASQGGMTAQLLAARYPSLVKKAVLGSTMLKESPFAADCFDGFIKAVHSGDVRAVNRAFFEKIYPEDYLKKYAAAFRLLETQGTKEEMRRFQRELEAMRGFDASREDKNIVCPVLVIGDTSDKILPPEASPELAAHLGAELFMYDGFGHAVYDTAPDYKEKIKEFFAKSEENAT